jgi:hypothetical protein
MRSFLPSEEDSFLPVFFLQLLLRLRNQVNFPISKHLTPYHCSTPGKLEKKLLVMTIVISGVSLTLNPAVHLTPSDIKPLNTKFFQDQ